MKCYNRINSGNEVMVNGGCTIFARLRDVRRIISSALLLTFTMGIAAPVFGEIKEEKPSEITRSSRVMTERGARSDRTMKKLKGQITRSMPDNDGFFILGNDSGRKPGNDSGEWQPLFGSQSKYQPYLELGFQKNFNQSSSLAGIYDLFIPLAQNDDQLVFTNLRLFDRSGSSSEGNFHLGYRRLDRSRELMLGIYGAYDQKRSFHGINYRQLTMGVECWWHRIFVGINGYNPLGKRRHLVGINPMEERANHGELSSGSRGQIYDEIYERALGGVDGELGYAFNDELTGYVGGYYFHGNEIGTMAGPKARINYSHQRGKGKILGLVDGVSLEAGIQCDQVRGTTGYVGIKLKIGLTAGDKNSNLKGFERHMVELVHRDPDIITGEKRKKFYQPGERGFQFNDDKSKPEEVSWQKLEDNLRILGLSKDATMEDVKKRFRQLALKYHPDRPGGDKNKFVAINGARDRIEELFEKLCPSRLNSRSSKTDFSHDPTADFNYSYEDPPNECSDTNKCATVIVPQASSIVRSEYSAKHVADDMAITITKVGYWIDGSVNTIFNMFLPPGANAQIIEENSAPELSVETEPKKPTAEELKSLKIKTLADGLNISFATSEVFATAKESQETDQDQVADSSNKDSSTETEQEKLYLESDIVPLLQQLHRDGHSLSSNQTDLLEQLVGDEEMNWGWEFQKSIAKLLTRYVIKDKPLANQTDFLLDWARRDTEIGNVAIAELDYILMHTDPDVWDNQGILHSFATLLPNLTNPHLLEELLVFANKHYNYHATMDALAYFFRNWASRKYASKNREKIQTLIVSSVKYLLESMLGNDGSWVSDEDFNKLEDYVATLRRDVGLAPDLLRLIFESHIKELRYFGKIIYKILAEDKKLDRKLLEQFYPVVANRILLHGHREDLFMMLRLVQHHIIPSEELLRYCLWLLTPGKEEADKKRVMALDIFYQLGKRIPPTLKNDLIKTLKGQITRSMPGDDGLPPPSFAGLTRQSNLHLLKIDIILENLGVDEAERALITGGNNPSPGKRRRRNEKESDELPEDLLALKNLIAEQPNLEPMDRKVMLRSVMDLAMNLDWPPDLLLQLLNRRLPEVNSLIAVLTKLAAYQIGFLNELDRDGNSAGDILRHHWLIESDPVEEVLRALDRLITDSHFFVARDLEAILEEIALLNNNNKMVLDLLASGYYARMICRIGAIQDDWSNSKYPCGISKPLAAWGDSEETGNDFKRWWKEVSNQDGLLILDYQDEELLAEVLAVLSEGARRTILNRKGYSREVQLLAALTMLGQGSNSGQVAQVATGEGKSLIIALFAAVKAMEGWEVDIMTSSGELAKRDAEDNKNFFNLFGITVDHNIIVNWDGKPKECYKSNIVYGDMLHFNGDALRENQKEVRHGRGYGLLMIDEHDQKCIDHNSMKVQLVGEMAGMDVLTQLLAQMWIHAYLIAPNFITKQEKKDKCYTKHTAEEAVGWLTKAGYEVFRGANSSTYYFRKNKDEELKSYEVYEEDGNSFIDLEHDGPCSSLIAKSIEEYTIRDLFAFDRHIKKERDFIVPSHLEQFAKDQLPHWIRAIVLSLSDQYREETEYVVRPNPGGQLLTIVPVDKDTGELHYKTVWGDGLHQFLQMKHDISITSESVRSIFMSYSGYMARYGRRIYGMTGTTGKNSHHEFIKEIYGTDVVVLPTFVPKDVTEFPARFVEGIANWHQEIIYAIRLAALSWGRAVLVVMESIGQMRALERLLLASGYPKNLIYRYGIGGDEDNLNVKRKLMKGEVIIATNLAGRGTDLQLWEEVLMAQGLHVIATMISNNIRTLYQAFGRTARKGEPGSVELIVNLEQVRRDFPISSLQGESEANDVAIHASHPSLRGTSAASDAAIHSFESCLEQLRTTSHCNVRDLSCLYDVIDQKEVEVLNHDKIVKLPRVKLEDDLYVAHMALTKQLSSPLGRSLWVGEPGMVVEPYELYLYGNNSSIRLKVYGEEGIVDKFKEDLDITELIKEIDPSVAKSLETKLANVGIVTEDNRDRLLVELSYRETELIYFIAASRGYARGRGIEIYGRVKLAIAEKKEQKPKKQFHLWLEDRDLYTDNHEISQLNEYWGFFARKHIDPLLRHAFDGLTTENFNLTATKQELKTAMSVFREEMTQKYGKEDFIRNGAHLILKAWNQMRIYFSSSDHYRNFGMLDEGVALTNRALKLEDTYRWEIHNTKATISMVRNGAEAMRMPNTDRKEWGKKVEAAGAVNAAFYQETVNALVNIRDVVLPNLEKMLGVLYFHGEIKPDSEALIKIVASIEYYRQVMEVLQRNMDNAVTASNSQGIVISSDVVDTAELTKSIDLAGRIIGMFNSTYTGGKNENDIGKRTVDEIGEAQKFGDSIDTIRASIDAKKSAIFKEISTQSMRSGGILFKTTTYKIEKPPKNWLGTIFSAVMGIAFICLGAFYFAPMTGVFFKSIAISLVAKGIGDVIGTVISAITGNPIELGEYLKSTAIGLGVTIVTAGLLKFIDGFGGANGLRLLDKVAKRELVNGVLEYASIKPLEIIATMAVTQTLVTAAGIAAYETIGRRTVSEEKVTARATESINGILGELANELQKIFAAGKLEVLIERVRNIVFEHTGRFTNEYANAGLDLATNLFSQTLTGTPIGYGLGSAIGAVPGITQMLIKNYEAVPRIEEKTKQAIRELAGTINQWQLLEGKFYTTFKDEAEILSQALIAQGFVVDGVADCSKIQDVQLEAVGLRDPPASYQRDLGTLCLQTNQELTQPRDYESLRNTYIELVSADLTDTRKDLHKKIGNTAVAVGMEIINEKYDFSQKMGEKIVGGINQAFDAIRAGERVEAGGGDTATRVNQPPRGDEAARDGPDSSPSEHLDQTTKDTDTNQLSLVNSLLKNPYGDPLLYDPFANPFGPIINPYVPYSQFYWKDIDLVVPEPTLDIPNVLTRLAAEAALFVYPEESIKKYGSYEKAVKNGALFDSLKANGFKLFDEKKDVLNGCHCIALKGSDNTIFIVSEGTSEGAAKLFDLPDDIRIAAGATPSQYSTAKAFAERIINDNLNAKIIFVGHSLGGVLSQMLTAEFGKEAMVFDSPGAKEQIAKLRADGLVSKEYNPDKIKIYNAWPNPINTCGEHVTTPIAVLNNEDGKVCLGMGCNLMGTFSSPEKPAEYLHSHGIKHIVGSIKSNGNYQQIPIQNWPTSSLFFSVSKEAYNAMSEKYDGHIRQQWNHQYENDFDLHFINKGQEIPVENLFKTVVDIGTGDFFSFRSKYPTFESYQSDYLKYNLIPEKPK